MDRLAGAYEVARQNLLSERTDGGHWIGELSTSALSTATAVSALSAVQNAANHQQYQGLIDNGVRWLVDHQNPDGGWGDTRKSYSNISTTLLAIACFHFARRQDELAEPIRKAERYVESQGGIPGLRRRYGKDKTFAVPILANCALAGTQDWSEVSALPFEAACVPQKFYHLMQLPVVSYAIPALVAIGQAKYLNDPPWNPLTRLVRHWSVRRSLRVLEKMQPASGGFLEAIPLTSFVVMGLASTGREQHAVVSSGVEFIRNSVLPDGSWPIDTNLATWVTTLSINALASESGEADNAETAIPQLECLEWILECQNRVVHPFTNSPPGGWGWTDLSGAVPDADDTPGALLALDKFYHFGGCSEEQKARIVEAAGQGVAWLLKLQNRDWGWPTFCRGWGRLPFDRSGADITAHVMRGIYAWRNRVDVPASKVDRAIDRGFRYLSRHQATDGSWLPLWFGNQDHPQEENPIYGTAKVLAAYHDLKQIESIPAQRGLKWLAAQQNSDGSWGGGKSMTAQFSGLNLCGELGSPGTGQADSGHPGTIEETALALEALLFSKELADFDDELAKGIDWLIRAVETDCYRIDSPIGFYFAKLWYHERLYPQVFAVSALGRAVARYRSR